MYQALGDKEAGTMTTTQSINTGSGMTSAPLRVYDLHSHRQQP